MRPLLVLLLLSSAAAQAAPAEALKANGIFGGALLEGEFPDRSKPTSIASSGRRMAHPARHPHRAHTRQARLRGRDDLLLRLVGQSGELPVRGKRRRLQPRHHEALQHRPRIPETNYIANGVTLPYRVQWTVGADSYEAFSEMYVKDKWVTQFKMVLKKQ
jgi:hypothetical protein